MKILIFQHLPVEHPGVFMEFWVAAGHECSTVELDAGESIPALDVFDLLVVLGGPMDVWQVEQYPWLTLEKDAIRRWVRDFKRPYLGICLGHQLLADALGGLVRPMQRAEVGLADVELTAAGRRDPLLAGLPSHLETFQWHCAEVARLPEGGEVLAANTACAIQAMRWGELAYGFQGHCEITDATVCEWMRVPAYHASLLEALGSTGAARLETVVAGSLSALRDTAQCLNKNLSVIVQSRCSVPAFGGA